MSSSERAVESSQSLHGVERVWKSVGQRLLTGLRILVSSDERFTRAFTDIIAVTLTIVVGLDWLAGWLIFHDEWTLFSYPSLITLMLLFLVGSLVAARKGRYDLAGILLVLATGGVSVGLVLIPSFSVEWSLPGMMFTVLVAAQILPRLAIFWVAGLGWAAYVAAFNFRDGRDVGSLLFNQAFEAGLVLVLLAILMFVTRLLRDERVAALAQARDQARTAQKVAEEATAVREQFASKVSHELRQPLQGILGFVDLLISSKTGAIKTLDPSVEQNLLERINSNGLNLLSLINDVLDFSRMEAGAWPIRPSACNPADVLHTVVETLEVKAKLKKLEISQNLTPDAPTVVVSDAEMLRIIWTNLISNAIKFTPEGGKITCSIGTVDERYWLFRVADTGIGMPLDAERYIFDRFRQVDGTAASTGGTGLGLAIVKELATLLHGSVAVETAPGKGSTFTVKLPRMYDREVNHDSASAAD